MEIKADHGLDKVVLELHKNLNEKSSLHKHKNNAKHDRNATMEYLVDVLNNIQVWYDFKETYQITYNINGGETNED